MAAFSYDNQEFISSESPVILNIEADLGHKGRRVQIKNDGNLAPFVGDLQFEISSDGTVYGGIHTLHAGELMGLDKLNVSKVRITWVADTAVQVFSA